MPDLKEKLVKQASIAIGSTPDEFARFLKEDVRKWSVAARHSVHK
jgi:hypothetical protein